MKSVSIVALLFVPVVSAIARNEANDARLAACLTLNQTFATQWQMVNSRMAMPRSPRL